MQRAGRFGFIGLGAMGGAAAAGFGREHDAAVVKVYERLSGVDVAAAAKGEENQRWRPVLR